MKLRLPQHRKLRRQSLVSKLEDAIESTTLEYFKHFEYSCATKPFDDLDSGGEALETKVLFVKCSTIEITIWFK